MLELKLRIQESLLNIFSVRIIASLKDIEVNLCSS